MIYTTLGRIREHNPCRAGWRELLTHLGKTGPDDVPLAYGTILDAVGLDDTLWCLRAEPHSRIWRMYAVRCARRVQHLLTDGSLQALDIAERHARGAATDEELDAARDAASVAARAASRAAAWAAAGRSASADAAWVVARAASRAAWVAARAAAWDAVCDAARDEQATDFLTLLAAHHAMPGESCTLVDW